MSAHQNTSIPKILKYALFIAAFALIYDFFPNILNGIVPIEKIANINLVTYGEETTNGNIARTTTNFYTVSHVVDGDTLDIEKNGVTTRVRLLGINTPETVDPRRAVECFGKEASNYVKQNFLGKFVTVKTDNTQSMYDKYNRLLAYVYLYDVNGNKEGEMINKVLIRDGYAYEYTYDKPYTYQADFKALQSAAEADGAGLWSASTCNGKK